jgi:hypothetical protein
MTNEKLAELEKLLDKRISAHPSMKRLSVLCDALERVLKRKSITASESDGFDKTAAREDWKNLARENRAHDPHG